MHLDFAQKTTIQSARRYAITIDGILLTSFGLYGNEVNIITFPSKQAAQWEITTFHSGEKNVKIRSFLVRIN